MSEPKLQFLEELRFLRGALARPRAVGAVAPSSPALARAIAAQIDPAADGRVLELGPGTGVVTQALVDRGISPERITAIEYDPEFARLVRIRFPRMRVLQGDAFDLGQRLDGDGHDFAAIVSGLPLLNHTPERRARFVADALERIRAGGPFVQFSYGLKPPIPAPVHASVHQAATVWRNLPPARVWVYRRH